MPLEFDGDVSCFPPEVQRSLPGYEEKVFGRNLFRAQSVFDNLAPGDDAHACHQHQEPYAYYLGYTHDKPPQVEFEHAIHHDLTGWETLIPELSDLYLDLHQSLADQGFAKSLDRSHGYVCVFCEPSSIKILAHLFGKNRSAQVKIKSLPILSYAALPQKKLRIKNLKFIIDLPWEPV